MDVFASAAAATVRIEYGDSRGSGFHFASPGTFITNYHVIAGAEDGSAQVVGVTEEGRRLPLRLLAHSPAEADDFAILRTDGELPPDIALLDPSAGLRPNRGTPVIFAGFPHGIPHLLVQQAIVAGTPSPGSFYIDGSVNGGNSGGPILDAHTGLVLGVVTQRRFLGGVELDDLRATAERIQNHCQAVSEHGSVQIMGIDFGAYTQLMASGMVLMRNVLTANANSGIGIGFSIGPLTAKCDELGLLERSA